jgi:hypothetical protein
MATVLKRSARRTSAARSGAAGTRDLSLGFTLEELIAPVINPPVQLNGTPQRKSPGKARPRGPIPLAADCRAWLAMLDPEPLTVAAAVECLTRAQAWARRAELLPTQEHAELFDAFAALARRAGELNIDADPVVHQLLAAELPLILSQWPPDKSAARQLETEGLKAWAKNAVTVLNGEGLPHARHLPAWRPLLASWTRCRAAAAGRLKFSGDDDPTQFAAAIEQTLRFLRADGRQVLGPLGRDRRIDQRNTTLLDAAARHAGSSQIQRLARLMRGASTTSRVQKKLPPASYECEWAELALMASHWGRNRNLLAAAYDGQTVRLELQAGLDLLASGPRELEVKCDGCPIPLRGPWHNVCWFSDADVDYLELQAQTEGVVVQRQMLLAKTDSFAYLADAVIAPGARHIECRSTLSLAPRVGVHPAVDSRELFLCGSNRRYSLLPLALPEWRRDRRGGELACESPAGPESAQETEARSICLSQAADGTALYAPLFIDLNGRRAAQPLTWRQLTVAQDRRNLPADVAVGYRVQAGKQQWIIYRSLGQVGNRTLLGHNLVSEFLVARFKTDGTVESLVEIEG